MLCFKLENVWNVCISDEGPGPCRHKKLVSKRSYWIQIKVKGRQRALLVLYGKGSSTVLILVSPPPRTHTHTHTHRFWRLPSCLRSAHDYTWYVDTILNLIRLTGDYVSEEVWHRIVQVVINTQEVQGYAAKTCFEVSSVCVCVCTCVQLCIYP